MNRISITGGVLAAGLALLGAPAAHAAGPPVENVTDHVVDQVSVGILSHPCTGQLAEVTAAESGVVHFLLQPDGTVHITGTLHGSFSADALPTDGRPDATGSYVVHFGGNGLLNEDGTASGKGKATFVVNGEATNADGTGLRWQEKGTTVFNPDGTPKLELYRLQAICP